MYNALEAFINYCDEMIITTESSKDIELNRKQIQEISKLLTEKYGKTYIQLYKKTINKFDRLRKVSFDYGAHGFVYNDWLNTFDLKVDGFDNYAYRTCKTEEEMRKVTNEFKRDITAFLKEFKASTPNEKGISVILEESEEGCTLSEYFSMINEVIEKHKTVPSNDLTLIIRINESIYKALIPSESQIKENEKNQYLKLYDEFVKFLKNPHKLSGNLWSGIISDICRIIGLSSAELNNIISKNIKSVGNKVSLYQKEFEDSVWENDIAKKLGDCYILESMDSDKLVYSINNKKLYWINYEHGECEVFYNDYPYNSREFEEVLYDDPDTLKVVKALFKEYNEKNNIKLF